MSDYEVGYTLGVVIGSIVMGLLVGLIPYFMAKKRGRKNFGMISIVICILANFLGGVIISIPVCLIVIAVLLGTEGNNNKTTQTNYGNDINNGSNTNSFSQTTQTQVYCIYCGAAVNKNSMYCTSCGHKLP